MYKRIYGRLLFYAFVVTGFFVAGWLIIGSYLSHPSPGRNELWYTFMVVFLPFLGIMGIVALGLRRVLGFPWWLGTILIAYPVIAIAALDPEMRRYLVDSRMQARLTYVDVGQFTGLDVSLFMLAGACVLGSIFFLADLNDVDVTDTAA